jgi:YggT family protein
MSVIFYWFIFLLDIVQSVFVLMMIVWIFMSYFAPTNSFYYFLGSIINPLLAPIRRMLPTFGGFDFSPLVLLILVQLLLGAVTNLLRLFL